MHKNWPEIADGLSGAIGTLRKGIPETAKSFSNLAAAAMLPGALDTKTKELICLAIGVALRCDGCVAFHAKAAVQCGATREEVQETISVGIYMGGGPSMVYGAQALEAYDQMAELANKK